MRTAVVSITIRMVPSTSMLGNSRGAPTRLAGALGHQIVTATYRNIWATRCTCLAGRCHGKGYLHPGCTMCLLLFAVHDGGDDDNDTDLHHYLHVIRRHYALLSENDDLERPVPGLPPACLPICLALY